MSTKRRWYELLLPGLVILLVLAAGTVRTANAYDYIESDWEPYEYHSEPINENESTYIEYAVATGTAYTEGDCQCTASARSAANEDRADADADSYASWLVEWTWDGPPESNAPGGDLTWIHDAGGNWTETAAWGWNSVSGISISSANGGSWTFGTEGSAWADIYVWGYITDGETIEGECDPDADPFGQLDEGTVIEYEVPPVYSFSVDGWDFNTGNEEIIDPGTTNFYFIGGVSCNANTTAISTEESEYWANAYAEAKVNIEVDAVFDSY